MSRRRAAIARTHTKRHTDAMETACSVRPATNEDCATLGVIAPAAYAAAYAYLWDDARAFVEQLRSFDADTFAAQINDPQYRIWLAEIDGAPVGFLSLRLDSAEPVSSRVGGAEIPRIYFLPQGAGKGIAKKLLHKAEATARDHGASYIWLDAMASADWAARTYEKWGFEKIGRDRFPKNVKDGEADMVVMIKALE